MEKSDLLLADGAGSPSDMAGTTNVGFGNIINADIAKQQMKNDQSPSLECQSYLGQTWIQKNGGEPPTHRQVLQGLIDYAQEVLEVDHSYAWTVIFSSFIQDLDQQIDV